MEIQDWYREAVQQLRALNWEGREAQVTARLLLDGTVGVAHAHLLSPRLQLEPFQLNRLRSQLEEVSTGRPVAYILGHRDFFGRRFAVDERALIPRPETELLVETAISQLQSRESPRIADLGTGTGCIAITLALELPSASVMATDVAPDTLDLARENAATLGAPVQFVPGILGDWAAPIRDFVPFDAIVSNPPYIATAEIADLQIEIRNFEPHRALDGGADGLDDYRTLATQCRSLLNPGGFIALELGAGQFQDVCNHFQSAGWQVTPPIHDLAGISRVLLAFAE